MNLIGYIDSIAFGGRGILRDHNRVIFIPFTAPGDQVNIEITSDKKRYAEGKLLQVIQKSPVRIEPKCPYFQQCGGCQFQHITDIAQQEIKRQFIEDALKRIGGISMTIPSIIPSQEPWNYRNHVRLKIFPREGLIGYIGHDHHAFIPIDQCPIFIDPTDPLFIDISLFLKQINWGSISSAHLRILKTNTTRYLLVFQLEQFHSFDISLIEQYLKEYPSWAGLVFSMPRQTFSIGDMSYHFKLLGLNIEFSPFGFIQNHLKQSEQLYQFILDNTPQQVCHALDLYCGVGITSLLLAKRGIRTIGIESNPQTVEIAQNNAKNNSIDLVEFYCGKAELLTAQFQNKQHADLVLLNPPRTGLDSQLITELLRTSPKYIIYVSCMPATLARDLQFFVNHNYHILKIQGFDLFPQTTHVETVVILEKN